MNDMINGFNETQNVSGMKLLQPLFFKQFYEIISA